MHRGQGRRSHAPHRRDLAADVLPGLRRAPPRRRRLQERDARRRETARRAQEGKGRRRHRRSAQQRRRLARRGDRSHRPVHRQGPGRAGAQRERPGRGRKKIRIRAWRGTARSPCSSIALRRPRRKSSPPRSRITAAASSSASRRSARAPCRTSSISTKSRTTRSPTYGEVKMTIAQFFRVNGGSTQLRGVTPDISFPLTVDATEFGESSYDNSLPWTSISPAHYQPAADLKPIVPMLVERHDARVKTNAEWQTSPPRSPTRAQRAREDHLAQRGRAPQAARRGRGQAQGARERERDAIGRSGEQDAAEDHAGFEVRQPEGDARSIRTRSPTKAAPPTTTACSPTSAASRPTSSASRPRRKSATSCSTKPPTSSPTRFR